MMQHPSQQEPPYRSSAHKKSVARHPARTGTDVPTVVKVRDSNSPSRKAAKPPQAGVFPSPSKSEPALFFSPSSSSSSSSVTPQKPARYAGGAYHNSPTACSLPAPTFEDSPDIPSPDLSVSPTSTVPIEALFLEQSGIFPEFSVSTQKTPTAAATPTASPPASPAPHHVSTSYLPPAPLMSTSPEPYVVPISRALFPPAYPVAQQQPVYYPQPVLSYPHHYLHSTSLPHVPTYAQFQPPTTPTTQPRFDSQASAHLRAVLKIQS